MSLIITIIEIIAFIVPILLAIAYLTLAERKIMGLAFYNKKIYFINRSIYKTVFIHKYVDIFSMATKKQLKPVLPYP